MADIKYGAQYGTAYRHVYADACQYGPRYFTASDTRRRHGIIVCPHCSGELHSVRVTFAIVAWRADADASRRYAADERSPYVVRSFVA